MGVQGERESSALRDGFQGRAAIALGHGGVGGARRLALIGDATATRCDGARSGKPAPAKNAGCREAPNSGGIQQGAASEAPFGKMVL